MGIPEPPGTNREGLCGSLGPRIGRVSIRCQVSTLCFPVAHTCGHTWDPVLEGVLQIRASESLVPKATYNRKPELGAAPVPPSPKFLMPCKVLKSASPGPEVPDTWGLLAGSPRPVVGALPWMLRRAA